MDEVHKYLDIAGYVPSVGDWGDLVNGGIYAFEGDWLNALISASAIFFDGATAGRLATDVTQEMVERGVREGAEEVAERAGRETAEDITEAAIKGGSDVIGTVGKTNPFDLQPTHSPTLSNNKMNALMDDIKVNGIQEPIKYVEYNGQMYVVDGHHRLLAAKRLGLTEVPIEKVDLPYAGYSTVDDLLWFE